METYTTCLFCGDTPTFQEDLLPGKRGAICHACIFSLAARLAETGRDGNPSAALHRQDSGVGAMAQALLDVSDEGSAHDYQSRIDLAAAYAEMGKRQAAVTELLAALESALLCGDYKTGLTCIARARRIADSPALRDRVCDVLTRLVPAHD